MDQLLAFQVEDCGVVKVYMDQMANWSFDGLTPEDARRIDSGEIYQVGVEVIVFDKSGEIEMSDSIWGVVVNGDLRTIAIETIKDYVMFETAKAALEQKLIRIFKVNGVA